MNRLFFTEFELFLQANNIQYVRESNVFYVKNKNYSICLVVQGDIIKNKNYNLYLYQDVWYRKKEIVKQRLLAHLGEFKSVFARNCEILSGRKNEKILTEINVFLENYHFYSNAKSKYKYALYFKGKIVAVASFSLGREMPRNINNSFDYLPKSLNPNLKECNKEKYMKVKDLIVMFESFEWVRYASLPNIRVVGGMGKVLKTFIKDILLEYPDKIYFEIMTYSDNEWGSGETYKKLKFKHIGNKEPVEYYVNKLNYKRINAKYLKNIGVDNYYKIKNQGSAKFLLQIIRTPHCSSLYSILI